MIFSSKKISDCLFIVLAYIREPSRRIHVFLALSALVHAVILWLPHLHLTSAKGSWPALTVRIDHQPAVVFKEEKSQDKNSQAKLSVSALVNAEAIKQEESSPPNSMKPMEKSADVRAFPKHVWLSFVIYEGAELKKSGDMQHQLDVDEGRYFLKSVRRPKGFGGAQFTQSSQGEITEQGLQPKNFSEGANNQNANPKKWVSFDRSKQKIHYSNGRSLELLPDTQDSLSYMYQLSQLSMHTEIISMPTSDGERLLDYEIEVGSEEKISTEMGEVRALHLRKIHLQGEPYFEIWLGLDYQLLPVMFQQVGAEGQIKQKFVINDLRSADR
jgi:hypothetical protein